jgi:type VI secretion system protein ImpM
MARALTEVGFYGKLPCRGDFLQRRAPQDFVDVWDAWLQQSLHESRQQLQASWLETYLTGPVWRFVLAPGVCGERAYAGVLVPSVDRVGRYFPLTLIATLDANDCLIEIACGSKDWFAAAESLVLDAIQAEALDFDTFDEHVALLRERLDTDGADESSRVASLLRASEFPGGADRWHLPIAATGSFQSAVNAFAYGEMARVLQPLALWWTEGSNAVAPSWLSTRGLPEPRAFVAMLDGNWVGAEWSSPDRTGAGRASALFTERS